MLAYSLQMIYFDDVSLGYAESTCKYEQLPYWQVHLPAAWLRSLPPQRRRRKTRLRQNQKLHFLQLRKASAQHLKGSRQLGGCSKQGMRVSDSVKRQRRGLKEQTRTLCCWILVRSMRTAHLVTKYSSSSLTCCAASLADEN